MCGGKGGQEWLRKNGAGRREKRENRKFFIRLISSGEEEEEDDNSLGDADGRERDFSLINANNSDNTIGPDVFPQKKHRNPRLPYYGKGQECLGSKEAWKIEYPTCGRQ